MTFNDMEGCRNHKRCCFNNACITENLCLEVIESLSWRIITVFTARDKIKSAISKLYV